MPRYGWSAGCRFFLMVIPLFCGLGILAAQETINNASVSGRVTDLQEQWLIAP